MINYGLEDCCEDTSTVEAVNELNIMTLLNGTAITLDIAPLHTGVVIWNGSSFEEYYFHLSRKEGMQDESVSPMWAIKQRRVFKKHLEEIVKGRSFDYCLVEGVYGGENYNTTVQLLNLNTVIDELILDGVCDVKTLYREKQTVWSKDMRLIYKQKNKPTSKVEVQNFLDYMHCSYYLEHKDDTAKQKALECFEDICDSYGMMFSIVAKLNFVTTNEKKKHISFSDIKMLYVEDSSDVYYSRDEVFSSGDFENVDLDFRNIEKSILGYVEQFPDRLLCAYLPPSKLGIFGVKHHLEFFCNEDDEGWLYFYKRR